MPTDRRPLTAPPASFEAAFDRLHEEVADDLGWDDFGTPDYRRGLNVLLQSMDYDPHFTEAGRAAAWQMTKGVLRARGHAVRAKTQHPEWKDCKIVAPVVITGLPRSGTTALHRLMAVDPRFQGLQSWLLDAPMPRPPRAEWATHPEFQRAVSTLEARYRDLPQKRAAHEVIADEVHECCMLLRQSFVSNILSCAWPAPTYDAWWQSQSEATAYEWFRASVQLIGCHEGERRWLLKNPGHIDNLDLLFAVFPDAKVIQTHRDPAKAVPSLCSLLMKSHSHFETRPPQQRARIMAAREAGKWAKALRRAEPVRQARPNQILDIRHADFHRAPEDVVDRIYNFIGMEIEDDLRLDIRARIDRKPEMAHGTHRYDIADFGTSPEAVREQFGDYVARFDLLEKKGADQ